MVTIRTALEADREVLAKYRAALWPESSEEEHSRELALVLSGKMPSVLPYATYVAVADDGSVVGFADISLRSYADGCDPARPVGYLEGWYVSESCRLQGAGAALLAAGEEWARAQGCTEFASDTWIDNEPSQRAHEALGFEEVDRCVLYRKRL
jgi:aminoglycoside 6'-N-acetyltransferase I